MVWKTLTTRELMGRWLMAATGFEPARGKRFTYQTTPAGEWDGVIHCEVLEVIPNERLVYTWKGGHEANVGYGSRLETVVTWTLSQVDDGTRASPRPLRLRAAEERHGVREHERGLDEGRPEHRAPSPRSRATRYGATDAQPASTSTSARGVSMKMSQQTRPETLAMKTPPIVSPQAWEAAREQMLVKEKALTRARDALAAERRRMPWMAVEKAYAFDGPTGKASLLDLFEGRRQLIVYRAFFEPGVFGWPDHACRGCSLGADQVSHLAHLNARDTTLVYASRAPQADIARLKARMGWEMPVVHHHRQLRRRLRRGRMARPQRLHPRRRPASSAPTSSTPAATRRWGPSGATSM